MQIYVLLFEFFEHTLFDFKTISVLQQISNDDGQN